ncbi:MAG: hypothetical protein IJI51_04830, partial [Lachnospiraceae bacterium]|nr:hypothetical protein [Lachnospiraceae bacterium]
FKNLLLGDFICEKMGVIPKKGDSFEYNNLKIRVEEVDHNRVLKAKIVTKPVSEETGPDEKEAGS